MTKPWWAPAHRTVKCKGLFHIFFLSTPWQGCPSCSFYSLTFSPSLISNSRPLTGPQILSDPFCALNVWVPQATDRWALLFSTSSPCLRDLFFVSCCFCECEPRSLFSSNLPPRITVFFQRWPQQHLGSLRFPGPRPHSAPLPYAIG